MVNTRVLSISESELMFVVAGQLYSQAPNREPRNVEIIMKQVRDKFRKDAKNVNEFYLMDFEICKIEEYVENLLMNIPEFINLNLSYEEIEKGVSVDDDRPAKFVTMYDKLDSESWKSDFIDLDAFIRNVIKKIVECCGKN
jgi:acyl carrier protein phosphodiesterase